MEHLPNEVELDEVEARLLGALIEKEMSTPEYYPLTLNSLRTACNQKSNRNPLVDFDERVVAAGLESLRDKGLARSISGAEMRVPKHYHRLDEVLQLEKPQLAILCELLLRGPQTVGELRGHCHRLHEFADLAAVEAVLSGLEERQEALVQQLPRQPGRKEHRYAHLLCGPPELTPPDPTERVEPAVLAVRADHERLTQLEAEVNQLRQSLEALQQQFDAFKEQFE